MAHFGWPATTKSRSHSTLPVMFVALSAINAESGGFLLFDTLAANDDDDEDDFKPFGMSD